MLTFCFPPYIKKAKAEWQPNQKDVIETQSMEDRSKNAEQSLAFSGKALRSVNSKTLSHFSKFSPRNIQSTKANERHSIPWWVAPAPSDIC